MRSVRGLRLQADSPDTKEVPSHGSMSKLRAGHRTALIRRTAVVLALTLSLAGCSSGRGRVGPRVTVAPPRSPVGSATQPPAPPVAADRHQPRLVPAVRVRVTDARGTGIMTLPLEEYVLGAVRAELPPTTLQEDAADGVLQVQAIVSRTYAIANLGRHAAEGFDLCDSAHCQRYRPGLRTEGPTDRVARVVAETREEIVTFQGRVIQALFHSNCGGHTKSLAQSGWTGADTPPRLRPCGAVPTSRTCGRQSTHSAPACRRATGRLRSPNPICVAR